MSSIHETAYPRFKPDLSQRELEDIYTPTNKERIFSQRNAHTAVARLALMVLLKTVQRLGYFVKLAEVPRPIISHIAKCMGARARTQRGLHTYEQYGSRHRLLELIRHYLDIKSTIGETSGIILSAALQAAETKQELADIINVTIEGLIRQRYELPGFNTLMRIAQYARNQVNSRYFRSLCDHVGPKEINEFDIILKVTSGNSGWNQLKREPKKPTNNEVREYLGHVKWLKSWAQRLPVIDHLPVAKYRQYVLEARALDATDLKDLRPDKRYALMIILVHAQLRKALDDAADIFIRKIRNLHSTAEEKLKQYHLDHRQRTEKLVAQFRDVLQAFQNAHTDQERGANIAAVMRGEPKQLLAECEEHMSYADNNYLPFLMASYHPQRPLLLNCLGLLDLASTSSDQSLVQTIRFVLKHRQSHKAHLEIIDDEISLKWLPGKWRRLVIKNSTNQIVTAVHRKYFELCVFTEVVQELQSGDLHVKDSDKYSDYREQLIDWDTYRAQVEDYGKMLDFPTDSAAFAGHLKTLLSKTASRADHGFPNNNHVEIIGNEISIRKNSKEEEPAALERIDKLLPDRLPKKNILDILVESERWLNLHKLFGPLSGFEAKIDEPHKRFVTTLFCYGCNLGPTQTARSVKGLSRKQVTWLNLRHITEERLEKAIAQVINAYNKFLLPKYWGTGKHASADGTKWNLYEQNLLSEYHIRYGGYGGIGYYHVSDMYIALFSHFIPCGVYEAIHILDGLIKNESDVQPDTLHGDTQAQSAPVFALAYLLGISLMPRIRGLKKLIFYRPDKKSRYEHIDPLFSESINWHLIETHLPDMLRIVLSIKAGKITPSTILRRLRTANRKNKLYFAFRELGRVVRTVFLLDYIGDVEMRKTIQSATTKSEEFNQFIQSLFFGGEGIIAENVRHEQRKVVKYNQLVANLVILHNVEAMTRVLKEFSEEGLPIDEGILGGLAPYRTQHINRFGDYTLDLNRKVQPMNYNTRII
jgi:TnpA family transposase